MLLQGIFPPITTPFYHDGNVYWKKLEHNVEQYSKTPISGLVVLGSTGEAILLSDEEKRDVLRSAITTASKEKVMIAGTGAESLVETLRMTEFAAELGYDAALVRTPYYYRSVTQPAPMLSFYRTLADRSPIPLLVYNLPQGTGYDIPAELVAQLAEHPNIIGIKESSGSLEKVQALVSQTKAVKRSVTVTESFEAVTGRMLQDAKSAVAVGSMVSIGALAATGSPKPSSSAVEVIGGLKTRQKEVGFQVIVGAAHQLYESLKLGASGAILGFAVPAPTACLEIYLAWKDRSEAIAEEKQARIGEAAKTIVNTLSVPAIKYAAELNGFYGGPARSPFLPLTAEQKLQVERLMANIKS